MGAKISLYGLAAAGLPEFMAHPGALYTQSRAYHYRFSIKNRSFFKCPIFHAAGRIKKV